MFPHAEGQQQTITSMLVTVVKSFWYKRTSEWFVTLASHVFSLVFKIGHYRYRSSDPETFRHLPPTLFILPPLPYQPFLFSGF